MSHVDLRLYNLTIFGLTFSLNYSRVSDSSVSIVTHCCLESLLSFLPDRLWGPPNGYGGERFTRDKAAEARKLPFISTQYNPSPPYVLRA